MLYEYIVGQVPGQIPRSLVPDTIIYLLRTLTPKTQHRAKTTPEQGEHSPAFSFPLKMNFKWISLCIVAQLAQTLCYPSGDLQTTNPALGARQIFGNNFICCMGDCVYQLVGNGDSHQNYFHKQVTENVNCGSAASCAVTKLETYTISYSVDVHGVVPFINGGFTVSESWTSGETYTCNGTPGEALCVWLKVAHTAYTIKLPSDANPSCTNQPYGPLVMESPNTDNQGGEYYCVTGSACRGLGQGYWES